MKHEISLKQYRAIDLACFSVLLILSQSLILWAASGWFVDQLYVVSPVAAVVAIVMMRWDAFAAVPAVLGGAAFCVVSGGTAEHFLIYCVGNLLSLVNVLLWKRCSKQRIYESAYAAMGYGLCVQLLMMVGRAAVAALCGYALRECLGFITTDSLSVVFTLVIVWIARRVDGLFEDQKHYLRRTQKERQSEGGNGT